jgi:hypothetical protein
MCVCFFCSRQDIYVINSLCVINSLLIRFSLPSELQGPAENDMLSLFIYFIYFIFYFISFIGPTCKRLHIIIQTKKITGYTSNGASANGTTRPMQGATPKLD